MVTPHFPIPKGGIELHVLGLTKNLVKRGHNVVIVTPSSENIRSTEGGIEIFGVKSFRLPHWPYYALGSFKVPYSLLSFVSIVKKLIKKGNIDVVHAQGQKYLYPSVSVRLSHLSKMPTVLTIHGTYGLKYYGYVGRFVEETFNRTVLAQTLGRASAVICCTQLEEGYAKQYCKNFQCFNIPNGIDVLRFRSAVRHKDRFREEYDIPLNKKVILFLGGLIFRKGVLELLDAVESVTKVFPEALFVIAGDGPLWREVEHYAAKQGGVRAFKAVPESEKHKLYALSDVFVLPSKSEGQPVTILEAMASQLHIVTTPVGGVPETLFEYEPKTYIPQCSAPDIYAGLGRALEIISKGHAFNSESLSCIEKFDWTRVVEETEKVYNHVLQG